MKTFMRNILKFFINRYQKDIFLLLGINPQLVNPVPWIIETCFHFHNYISSINFTSLKFPHSWILYNIIRRFIEHLVTCAVVKKTLCIDRRAVSGCLSERDVFQGSLFAPKWCSKLYNWSCIQLTYWSWDSLSVYF